MNEGDEGSTGTAADAFMEEKEGWIERPLRLRGFLGEGEVIGRQMGANAGTVGSVPLLDNMVLPNVVEG